MDTIKNYLENMFATLPKNQEVLRLKNDLLESMEDKYNELKQNGRSENEAVGIVISEFGNIDELVKELGIDIHQSEESGTRFLEDTEVEKFLKMKISTSKAIAFGVWLCLMAPAILVLIGSFSEQYGKGGALNMFHSEDTLAMLGLIPFFVLIAAAVGVFILSGLKMEKYEFIEKTKISISNTMRKNLEAEKEAYQMTFGMGITIGVILCVLSPLAVICTFVIFGENNSLAGIGVTILLVMISIATAIFIIVGTKNDAYNQLLQEGDYAVEKKENSKIVDAVAAVYWPLVVIGYLVWSFTTNNWGFTWIVWPVAGIAFGAFAGFVNALKGNK